MEHSEAFAKHFALLELLAQCLFPVHRSSRAQLAPELGLRVVFEVFELLLLELLATRCRTTVCATVKIRVVSCAAFGAATFAD